MNTWFLVGFVLLTAGHVKHLRPLYTRTNYNCAHQSTSKHIYRRPKILKGCTIEGMLRKKKPKLLNNKYRFKNKFRSCKKFNYLYSIHSEFPLFISQIPLLDFFCICISSKEMNSFLIEDIPTKSIYHCKSTHRGTDV